MSIPRAQSIEKFLRNVLRAIAVLKRKIELVMMIVSAEIGHLSKNHTTLPYTAVGDQGARSTNLGGGAPEILASPLY